MSSRNIAIWESPYDLQKLSSDGLNLCIAKSVIDSSGHPSFNMVWKSLNLAPRANISWNTQYGLNWALNVPTANAQVTLGGVWQACNPGEVYDIDNVGLFQPSTVTPQPGYLKVGKNGYSYGGSSGIHIIVGVQSSPGAFDPVCLHVNLIWMQFKRPECNYCSIYGMIQGLAFPINSSYKSSMLTQCRYTSIRQHLHLACLHGISRRKKLNGGTKTGCNQPR